MSYWDSVKKEREARLKVNAVFIPEEDRGPKGWCDICKRYMVYSEKKSVWICTNCGDELAPNVNGDMVVNDFKSEPMLASAKGKKKHSRSDFPEGAYIKEDVQINPDGEEKDLIIDDKDV